MQPFFTIVIPTFNRANLLPLTLDSILNQTFEFYEVIIIDDGSTDNTKERIKPYLSEKITYYYKKNEERGIARNFGTSLAKGQYINWFDSDDLMLPNHLEVAYDTILKKQYPEIFALGFQIMKENKVIFETNYSEEINNILFKGNPIACNPVFVKKEIALQNPFYTDRKLAGSEDFELWLRLASKYTIYFKKTITSILIQHDQRSVFSMRNVERLEDRFLTFIDLCKKNKAILNLLGRKKNYFFMNNYLILAVDLAFINCKKLALKYLSISFKYSWKIVLNKTFYATIKHLVFK